MGTHAEVLQSKITDSGTTSRDPTEREPGDPDQGEKYSSWSHRIYTTSAGMPEAAERMYAA